jgi:hypothetical protein
MPGPRVSGVPYIHLSVSAPISVRRSSAPWPQLLALGCGTLSTTINMARLYAGLVSKCCSITSHNRSRASYHGYSLKRGHEPQHNFPIRQLPSAGCADPISVLSWRPRMLNRRTLILSAGKATVLLPATAASHALVGRSSADRNRSPHDLTSGSTLGEVRCQWLCIGRAALAQHFRESDQ